MNNERRNIQKKGVKLPVRSKSEKYFILYSSILVFISLITFKCYHYTLNNRFTNWDDDVYIYNNPIIKNLSSQNINRIFKDVSTGNYHPLTMLSLALNWHYADTNPLPYYATEIILHILNTVLVFFLALALFNAMVKRGYGKIEGIPYLAGLCALWHGIHPMHVESVSWVAERKDLLYFFFYLFGLIIYVKYITKKALTSYLLVFSFFILSLFSKPMAIVFPFSLFAFDVLLKRKIEKKLFIEKIPFFFISIIFTYITYKFQNNTGAVNSFSIFQRMGFTGYNYLMYIVKLFFPFRLSSFYPYPALTESNNLPFYFYMAPLAAIAFTAGLLYFAYKKGENYFRVALFGFGFYFFNVLLILQFVSAGAAIMADRYSYAAYFGLTFMLIYFIYVLANRIPSFKIPVIIVVTAFSCMFVWLCQARTHVWHNTQTMWKDVIAKYPADSIYNQAHSQYMIHVPSGIEIAYKNLGAYYVTKDTVRPADYDSALMNFEVLEKTNTKDAQVYNDIGGIWTMKGNFKKSLAAYTNALKTDSVSINSFDVFCNRAITYSKMGEYELAVKDFNRADKIEPNNRQLYENRGYAYLNGVKSQRDPFGQMDSAIADYTRLIGMEPSKDYYYFNLSLCYKNINNYKRAVIYANKAKAMGYKLPDGYIEGLQQVPTK